MTVNGDEHSTNHENDDVFDEDEVDSESKKTKPPTLRTVVVLIIILLVYIGFNLLGAVIFIKIEKTSEEGSRHWFNELKQEFLKNNSNCITEEELDRFLAIVKDAVTDGASPISNGNETIRYPEVWNLHNAFTLSFTIASTIGYGLVTPVTPGGQIFCIFFALVSIPFTGLLAAKVGSFVAYSIKKTTFKAFGQFIKGKIITIVIIFLFGVILYFVIPTLLMLYVGNDEGWTFVECLYCTFITLTTIGFGDYVPNPSSSWGSIYVSIGVLVYVVAGLAWLATIINLIAMALKQQAATLKQKVVKNQKHLRSKAATSLQTKA